VVIALAGAVLVTGALHEDGFADCCDGFGGGWNKAQVLTIMKDPRVGSYGAIGLTLLFIAKLVILLELANLGSELVVVALLVSHPASRLLVLILTSWLDYVGSSDDSKSNNMVVPGFSLPMLGLSSLFVLLPVWLMNSKLLFSSIFIAAVAILLFGFYCKRRIGGYTGDCLGASQQIGEVVIYLSILAQWTST
jgi:adenosylcobinamide-GDP ribazoletransferase